MRLLEDELEWRHPKGKVSRFDCSIHPLANHDFLRRYGISHDGVNLCNFVREHRMEREDALATENDVRSTVDNECQQILERIGLVNYELP